MAIRLPSRRNNESHHNKATGTVFFLLLLITLTVGSRFDDEPVTLDESAFAFALKSESSLTLDEGAFAKAIPIITIDATNDQSCQPKHIHVAAGPEPWNSMMVSFSTSCKPENGRVSVKYGINPFHFDDIIYADPIRHLRRYDHVQNKTTKMVFYASDYIYHVPLTGLKENQLYFYQCNVEVIDVDNEKHKNTDQHLTKPKDIDFPSFDKSSADSAFMKTSTSSSNHKSKTKNTHSLRGNESNTSSNVVVVVTSSVSQFTTAPLPGRNRNIDGDPIKLAFVGDLGQTYNSSLTMYHMLLEAEGIPAHSTPFRQSSKASLAICAGDMSYSNRDQKRWDNWFELISPLTSRLPLMVAPGNHEIECDAITHEAFMAYENRFAMPNVKDARKGSTKKHHCMEASYDYGNSYYAFTYGMARIIVANCYSSITEYSPQYDYILKELLSVDRSITPWLFVVVHCPFYNTFKAHAKDRSTVKMRVALEPLFVKYKVNLVIAGHTHGYMRSKNVAFGTLEKVGPVYLVVGEGGNRERHAKHFLQEEPEEWVAVRDKKMYGFGTVEMLNATYVRWKWVRSDDLDVAGVKDDCLIENQLFVGME